MSANNFAWGVSLETVVKQRQDLLFERNSSTEAREGGASPQNTSRSMPTGHCPGKYRLWFMQRDATLNIDDVLCTE